MSAAAAPAASVVFLHPDDNLCVAIRNLPAGTQVEAGGRKVAEMLLKFFKTDPTAKSWFLAPN